jgi:hypothetical protein
MLAHANASTNQIEATNALLQGLNSKMIFAIDHALGCATKVAFLSIALKLLLKLKQILCFHHHMWIAIPLATRHSGYCLST